MTPDDRGFTLFEVLVALVVVGFLFLGLTNGVQLGVRARDMQARWIERQSGLEPVDRTLRGLIARTDPGSFDQPASLIGGPRQMELISTLPVAGSTAPGRRIAARVFVDRAHHLTLQWSPAPHASSWNRPELESRILLDRVDRLELAYWRPADEGGGWVDAWANPSLPALVRIRIVFPQSDSRHWPDIVVRPMRQPGTG